VMKVSPGADLFLNIRVKPSANLSRLEEVLVITRKEDRAPSAAETNSVRAVDILTQRLPSVPDKPAVDTNQAVTETPAKPATVQKAVPAAKKSSQETAKPAATSVPSQPAALETGTSEDKPH
jgi:rod shape-determining protein MreC